VGLKSQSSDVQLFFGYRGSTLSGYYGHGDELFDAWFKISEDFERDIDSITSHVQPDLIHCHNAPDSLTVATLKLFKGKIPVIHDIHDLLTLRKTRYDDGLKRKDDSSGKIKLEEKAAAEGSDGLIAVSETILEIAGKKYKLDRKESLVFPNYVVKEMIPAVLKPKLSCSEGLIHIVYEGHLDSERSGGHYDLLCIFEDIVRQGIHIHIYPSRENEMYADLGEMSEFIHYYQHLSPPELMAEMTRYDFGWSGFNVQKNRAHADTVLANKTFEYIAAGLPVITFPHESQKRFVEKHGVGVVIEKLDHLAEELSDQRTKDIKEQVLKSRYAFTVAEQISHIYEFYRKIVNSG
jgi:glycosyltransferase involved in cell wall biosynthesis